MKQGKNIVSVRLPVVPAAGLLLALAIGSARAGDAGGMASAVPEPAPEPAGAGAETHPLAPMFVTTLRTVADPIDVPYAADIVGPADFERLQPRSTTEALQALPSVMLQKTGNAQGSPFIRGFTGFRNVMLIDGIRLNNSTFRDGPNQYWATVDSLSLDRLELVRGAGSVLYGSDAIGGTVNAIPKSRATFGPGFGWDAHTSYRYSSGENSSIARAEFEGNVGDQFGFQLGGSYKNFGDIQGGDDVGEQPETGYDEQDLDARLQWKLNENAELVYGHQTVVQNDAWRTHATIYGLTWEGLQRGTDFDRILDQNRNLDYLQLHAMNLDGFVQQVDINLSLHQQDERETRLRSNRRREYQGVDVDTLGTFINLQSETPVGQWVYGVDYYRDWVDSFFRDYNANGTLRSTRLQGPVADDSTYDLFGAFVEDSIPLANDRLELNVGGRYSWAYANVGKAQDPATGAPLAFSQSWDTLVGSGRLLWHIDEEKVWNVFGGVSQGFRAPNLSDLSRFDIALSGEQEVPAFNLKPEEFVSVEGGLKFKKGRFAAEASYYETFISDMIVRVPTGQTLNGASVVSKANSGDGNIHGVEVSGQVDLSSGFMLWGNFSWMEGTVDVPLIEGGPAVTSPATRMMPTTVNYGLRWEHESRRYWAEFAGTVACTQDRLSPSDQRDTQRIPPGGTPGYEIYHLRAGWRPCKNFDLVAAVENLSDADYRIHGSGVNEPGRNFIVTADLRF